MGVDEIIQQIEALGPSERRALRLRLDPMDQGGETLGAAIEAGLADLEANRAKLYRREDLAAQVRTWAGGSR